jgi:hypothetical protein
MSQINGSKGSNGSITITGLIVADKGLTIEKIEITGNVDTEYLAQAGQNTIGMLNSPVVKWVVKRVLAQIDKVVAKLDR